MPELTIYPGDNLATLQQLQAAGARFDLVEMDGPYGAGLESWDTLREDEYVAHYAARLPLVRDVLQPWGVTFLFGYPEGCAEIKAWARQTGTLYLRRWLTWYKQRTAHKGRKCETILLFVRPPQPNLAAEFKIWLKAARLAQGLKIVDCCRLTGINDKHLAKVGGWLWFENENAPTPTAHEYLKLGRLFNIPAMFDQLCTLGSYGGLTDLDYISFSYPEETKMINSAGLRSKPMGLYSDLFTPAVPPRAGKRALILYGGSGNAAIAAGRLGYDVTVCETDPARCDLIRRRWAGHIEGRDLTPVSDLGPMFAGVA
jgi:hypothetical protein